MFIVLLLERCILDDSKLVCFFSYEFLIICFYICIIELIIVEFSFVIR